MVSEATTLHDASELPLRFVALGGSLVSDLGNPVASSARAILVALAAAGHDVTFLEQRNHPALIALLRTRGAAAYRAFMDRYPTIQYRTYDPVQGWERTVWFNREIATASAVIALPGTPDELVAEIAANTSDRLVRLIDASFGGIAGAVPLVRVGQPGVVFGPAALRSLPDTEERLRRPLLVAYDDAEEAREMAVAFAGEAPELVVTGSATLPGWRYVPEVALPDEFARFARVAISGAGDDGWPLARYLLPPAAGATLIDPPPPLADAGNGLPPKYDAATQAAALIATIRRALHR